jgi:hypothetical protein
LAAAGGGGDKAFGFRCSMFCVSGSEKSSVVDRRLIFSRQCSRNMQNLHTQEAQTKL